ncbi:MAG: FapA family protein [Desulfobacter postgatei]|uniref:FapA family protein n=1 Tax=Desulfobacter postgatei TaxID=2293 RepID=UPI0023F26DBF|nr:FapA family protein [Desulfobacter postgatei]MDD4274216.1 FapA family protein [Desulfobacter postgatei]
MKSDVNKINAEQANNIPTLADLAVKYGTISQDQHGYLIQLFTFKNGQAGYEDLLRDEGMATPYQLELLKLIQEYLIVRKSGEEFGKIAIEKGLATTEDINQALELQRKVFKKSRHKKLIGDILVETRILTIKQKDLILKEQNLFNRYSDDLSNKQSRAPENAEKGRGTEAENPFEISISVSSDHMGAWIERRKPDEIVITLNQVKDAVMTDGIINGIYPDSFIQCFLDSGVKKFPVARVDCFDLLKRQGLLSLYISEDNGNPIEKKKGEVLIEQKVTAMEVQVKNLYGEQMNAVAGNGFAVRCGENTRRSRDKLKILAGKSGMAGLSADRKVFIHPVLHLLKDADYRHGPIEPYADLSVSGAIIGAYPITAGKVSAEEIWDANIDAIGDIRARVGITNSIIRAQGDVHARYLHNSRIETFGNVYVQNEIIDSQIRCGGKFESPTCRVISSKIYAKGGVIISGVGSERAAPSRIVAGGEQHVVGLVQTILDIMNSILDKLEELKGEQLYQQAQADKIFKKMIKLKSFHDKTQKKKDVLLSELNRKMETLNKKTLANIQKLISTYDKRVNSSLATLKTMNATKKEHDTCVVELEKEISIFTTQAKKEIFSHETTLFAYLEKSKERNGVPIIEITGKAYAGTTLGGVYQIVSLTDDQNGFTVEEVWPQGRYPELQFLKRGR